MRAFELHFRSGKVTGQGVDLVGPFEMRGEYDADGRVLIVKHYLGKHRVTYRGAPDGEGSIGGRWQLDSSIGDIVADAGLFLMHPVLARPRGDEGIVTLKPRG